MKVNYQQMLQRICRNVHEVEPEAEVWLYGSRARKDARDDSDWDVLVLSTKPVLTFREEEAFMEKIPLKDLWGVGKSTFTKLESLRIRTVADLKTKPLTFLEKRFGKAMGLFSHSGNFVCAAVINYESGGTAPGAGI